MEVEERIKEIRRKIAQEVCKTEADVEPSAGLPWNGWCVDETGFSTFRAGVWWRFLEKFKEALEREGLTETEEFAWVVARLKEVEEEWRVIMGVW